MSDMFFGGSEFSRWLVEIGLPPVGLAIALVSAGCGTIFLSRHTARLGFLSYPINFCILLAGAIAANLVLSDVHLPFGFTIERPLIISIGGMLYASLIVLLVMPRNRQGG